MPVTSKSKERLVYAKIVENTYSSFNRDITGLVVRGVLIRGIDGDLLAVTEEEFNRHDISSGHKETEYRWHFLPREYEYIEDAPVIPKPVSFVRKALRVVGSIVATYLRLR